MVKVWAQYKVLRLISGLPQLLGYDGILWFNWRYKYQIYSKYVLHIIGIIGFHFIEQKRAYSLGFLLSSSADSATPAVISEIEPSGGCSVWIKDWFCDSNPTLHSSFHLYLGTFWNPIDTSTPVFKIAFPPSSFVVRMYSSKNSWDWTLHEVPLSLLHLSRASEKTRTLSKAKSTCKTIERNQLTLYFVIKAEVAHRIG